MKEDNKLIKGKKLPVGTVREWSGQKYKKVGTKWELVSENKGNEKKTVKGSGKSKTKEVPTVGDVAMVSLDLPSGYHDRKGEVGYHSIYSKKGQIGKVMGPSKIAGHVKFKTRSGDVIEINAHALVKPHPAQKEFSDKKFIEKLYAEAENYTEGHIDEGVDTEDIWDNFRDAKLSDAVDVDEMHTFLNKIERKLKRQGWI